MGLLYEDHLKEAARVLDSSHEEHFKEVARVQDLSYGGHLKEVLLRDGIVSWRHSHL